MLFACSYCYSADKAQSLFDLESKLSFLLLPLIVGGCFNLSRREFEVIFFSLIAGVVGVSLFCFGQAVWQYAHTLDYQFFFYHQLVTGLEANAVYIAWYTFTALTLLLLFPWRNTWLRRRDVWGGCALALLIFLIFLSARMLIFLFFVVLVPVYLFGRQPQSGVFSGRAKGWLFISVAFAALALYAVPNPIVSRYKELVTEPSTSPLLPSYAGIPVHFNNLDLRVFLWRVGLENMAEHQLWWFGAGNGDVHVLQNLKMAALGIPDMTNPVTPSHLVDVNLHNMFLQTLLMIGFVGLVPFLALMILPFLMRMPQCLRSVATFFQISSLLFMMQESALQTQAGIIFYTLMYALFMNGAAQNSQPPGA